MKSKTAYFLLYSQLAWLIVSVLGLVVFFVVEFYLPKTNDPSPSFFELSLIVMANLLPFAMGVGWRVFKPVIEREHFFERFLNVVSEVVLLFLVGIFLTAMLIGWGFSRDERFVFSFLEILRLFFELVSFWLEGFPLNLIALGTMLGLKYFFSNSIDKRVFKGKVQPRKTNLNLYAYSFRLSLTIFLCMTIVGGGLFYLIVWIGMDPINDPEQSVWARLQNQMPYIAIAMMPYAGLMGLQVWGLQYFRNPLYKSKALVVTLLLALLSAIICCNVAWALVNGWELLYAIRFGISKMGKSLMVFANSFPFNLLAFILAVPVTLFWYKYMEQGLTTSIKKEDYEHLIEE